MPEFLNILPLGPTKLSQTLIEEDVEEVEFKIVTLSVNTLSQPAAFFIVNIIVEVLVITEPLAVTYESHPVADCVLYVVTHV